MYPFEMGFKQIHNISTNFIGMKLNNLIRTPNKKYQIKQKYILNTPDLDCMY